MGTILTIAIRDFKSYFYSLKAAAIFWFFLLFLGFFFHSFLYTFVSIQERTSMLGGEGPTLEQLISAIFNNLHFLLLLIIPAVTMASFAEESKHNTIKLLQTAPINPVQIVLGKYCACMGLMTLVIASSIIFVIFMMAHGNPDPGPILSSYLGLFLLTASQVAFGVWVSSLTNNQFISFVFTMAWIFMLMILNWIAPNITKSDSTAAIVKYLATTTHFNVFLSGMITVSDVVYFLSFITIFLFFTIVVLDSRRWR